MGVYHDDKSPKLSREEPVIHIDVSGVKVHITPSDPGTRPPKTWRETAKRVNDELKRFTAGLFGMLADLPDGIRRMWRGLTGIPSALMTRIGGPRIKPKRTAQKALVEHMHIRNVDNNPTLPDPEGPAKKKLPQPPDKTLPSGPETTE